MRRSKAANHWPWIVIVVLLILSFGGMTWRSWPSRKETGQAGQRPQNLRSESSVLASTPEQPATATVHQGQPKLHRIGSKARVRVRPGETAVMGYYEIAPGKLGLTMVTPAALENGQVSLQLRTLEISDSEKLRSHARDILPDVFELESSGVISETRMNELFRFMNDNDVKIVSSPRMTTRPGQGCSISSGINEPGGSFKGVSYALQADSIQDGGGGFDLSVDFNRSGTRPVE